MLGRANDRRPRPAGDHTRGVRVIEVTVTDKDRLRLEGDQFRQGCGHIRRPVLAKRDERVEQHHPATQRGGQTRGAEPRENHLVRVDATGDRVDVL